jgi:hypothetical protein
MAYNDGSEVEIVCEPEDPPKSGVWVDGHVHADEMDAEMIAKGNMLGEVIDIDDDDDNGGF